MHPLRYLLLVFVLLGVMKTDTSSFAQSSSYAGLDVILLVDQSGSMREGTPRRPTATDPLGILFDATQFAIDWLGNFRAQQALFGTELDINVAVVNFGGAVFSRESDTEIALPLTDLVPTNLENWQDERGGLLNQVSEETFGIDRDLGQTDFISAFEQAFDLLPADSSRFQVIIVLTDGTPCAPLRFIDNNCSTFSDLQNHMRAVNDRVDERFAAPNQQVYVVALDAANDFWGSFAASWEQIAPGRAEQITRADEIGVRFNDILIGAVNRLPIENDSLTRLGDLVELPRPTNIQLPLPADENSLKGYDVPPYQQLMSVTLFKSRNDSELVLFDPNQKRLGVDSPSVSIYDDGNTAIAVWQILNPTPGRWQMGTEFAQGNELLADPNANISVDLLRAIFRLNTPQAAQAMYRPVAVGIQVTDANNQPIEAYSDASYRLEGTVRIIDPNGATQSFDLEQSGEEAGFYGATFTPIESGDYRVEVQASAGSGEDQVTFEDSDEDLRVNSTTIELGGLQQQTEQFVPAEYTLNFRSGGQLVSGIQVNTFEIMVTPPDQPCDSGASPIEQFSNTLGSDESGAYKLTVEYSESGARAVCLNVAIVDEVTGQPHTPDDIPMTYMIEVVPVKPLSLKLTDPVERQPGNEATISLTDRATFPTWLPLFDGVPLNIRPYWAAMPVRFTVQVVEQADVNTPVNLASELSQTTDSISAESLFTLHLTDNHNTDLAATDGVALRPTGDPSIWSATFEALPSGNYTLFIEANAAESVGSDNLVFLPDDRIAIYRLAVNPNYGAWLFQAIVFGSMALVAGSFVLATVIAPTGRRLSRVTGTLAIYCKDGITGKTNIIGAAHELGSYERQRHLLRRHDLVHLRLGDLPVVRPPLTHLSVRLQPGKRSRYEVIYGLQGKKTTIPLEAKRPYRLPWDNDQNEYFIGIDVDAAANIADTAELRKVQSE